MKMPVAIEMMSAPFTLAKDEKWIIPIVLGLFLLLTLFGAVQLRMDEGNKRRFQKKMKVSALLWLACEVFWQLYGADSAFPLGPVTGILFLYALSETLVYGAYLLAKKKKTAAR